MPFSIATSPGGTHAQQQYRRTSIADMKVFGAGFAATAEHLRESRNPKRSRHGGGAIPGFNFRKSAASHSALTPTGLR
jgi:hypothetical protein